jgi:hypothetical protein
MERRYSTEMINIADLSSAFETLLNNNTLQTKFKTFYWIENLDRNYTVDGNADDGFIASVILNQSGQYRPIPNQTISDQSFTLQIFFPQGRKDEILANIEQLANKVVGKVVTVDTKPLVFNMDIPTLSEIKQEHIKAINLDDPRLALRETENYGIVQLRFYFVESTGLMYGNSVKYSLKKTADANYVELIRLDANTTNSKSLATEQFLNSDSAVSVVQFNAFTNSLTCYFVPTSTLHQEIVADAENGTNQNRQYNLKIEYGTVVFTKTVIIESVNIAQPLGNLITLSLTFKKAG